MLRLFCRNLVDFLLENETGILFIASNDHYSEQEISTIYRKVNGLVLKL